VRSLFSTLIAFTLAGGGAARAEPEHVIRMSSIAPEGTGYARELRAMATETLAQTQGRVRIKPYFGAVAGDEHDAWQRVKRGQLDAVASAAMLCETLAPSMRVMRLPGLFRNRDEASIVLGRIKPIADREYEKAGARNLGAMMMGPVMLFTREPVHSVADLRKHALGYSVLPLPINEAARAFEAHRHDGFTATPAAALAFQWSTLARYVEPLTVAYLTGCIVVANRAYDELALSDQQALSAAAAKALLRIDAVGRDMDEQLLGGLFGKQGLRQVPVSSTFQVEFDVGATRARAALMASHAVDAELVGKVEQMLTEIRNRPVH
jgi:TRAP-type C4-dicarboxylate transport system substrate-binding protein